MSGGQSGFRIGWVAGPSAQIEVFSPGTMGGSRGYQMKYTPPFRSTIRPPVEDLYLGPTEIDFLKTRLDQLVARLRGRSETVQRTPSVASADSDDQHDMQGEMASLGDMLLGCIIPPYVQDDLAGGELFLEIGMDEALLAYPWELMHDGDDFMCLKHFLGRFVNSSGPLPQLFQRPSLHLGSSLEKLSILIICVYKPQERNHTDYESLPQAEAETDAILETLSEVKGVETVVASQKEATLEDVWNELKTGKYHIVHYSGHARFDERDPYRSGLVLFDRDMTTGLLVKALAKKPPIICCVNGCETAKSVDVTQEKGRLDIYGLARAFLDTGAYLLGSRWKVNDKSAAAFATQFYKSLIEEGKAVGHAVLDARKTCREAVSEDVIGWASYVYYGDPRVCFQML